MEINSAVVSLAKIGAFGGKSQMREFQESQSARENPGKSKSVEQIRHSQAQHAEGLSIRSAQMSNMVSQLREATPALQEAAAFMIERSNGFSMSFAYSFSQDQAGNITQSFTFSFSFKMAGDNEYTPVLDQPAEEPVVGTPQDRSPAALIDGPEALPLTTDPIVEAEENDETQVEAAVEATSAEEINDKPVSFDERVSQLIAYYSIDATVTTGDPKPVENVPNVNAAEASGDEGSGDDANAIDEGDAGAAVAEAPTNIELARQRAINAGLSNGVVFGVEASRVGRLSTGGGDDIVGIIADAVKRIRTGGGDDSILINADKAKRINSGAGDDLIAIAAHKANRISSGSGNDTVYINADRARHIYTGSGDDVLNIEADKVSRVRTGDGDDQVLINADNINRVNAGDGNDVLNLSADRISRINGGAGDDTIILNADDAGIYFGPGGSNDVVDIQSVGALSIKISSDLASSPEEMSITRENGNIRLDFASGESLTLNNVDNADFVSVRIGDEAVDLQLSEPTIELDISA